MAASSEPIAYLGGRYIPISEAALHVFDMGIVHGASVSEVLRTFHHQPFRFAEHLSRLMRSVKSVGFDCELRGEDFEAIVTRVVSENARLIPPQHDLGVTVFVTAGPNPSYVGAGVDRGSTVCVHTFPLPFELWADKYVTGQHLVTPEVRQVPPSTLDPRIKSRSRLHWYMADRQARQIDPQASALVLDQRGFIAETGTANFLIVERERLLTPPAEITLGGISRQIVAEQAEAIGMEFVFEELTIDRALAADEALTSSTPYCLLPVTVLNQQPIGGGRPGPVFRRLIEAWNALVDLDIIAQAQMAAAERRGSPASRVQSPEPES